MEDLDNEILLNTLELDKLNAYQDLVPSGDGFFDFFLVLQLSLVLEESSLQS